jgi:hypothetical protein
MTVRIRFKINVQKAASNQPMIALQIDSNYSRFDRGNSPTNRGVSQQIQTSIAQFQWNGILTASLRRLRGTRLLHRCAILGQATFFV